MAAVRRITPVGAPEVHLLQARAPEHDEAWLRAGARALGAASGRQFVSRSYRFPWAAVACHSAEVGVDIERVEQFDPVFLESILTPQERAQPVPGEGAAEFLYSVWSSKEALAKALGDALDYDPRRLEAPAFWPGGRAGVWRAAPLTTPVGHTGWLCWRSEES